MMSIGRLVLLSTCAALGLMLLPGASARESTASYFVHEHGPVDIPAAAPPCTLSYYKLPLDPNGKPEALTQDRLQSLLEANGIIFPAGGFAIYIVDTGVLLLATVPAEHKALAEALAAD